MTHELKTPISTISVASELLLNEKISLNSELTRKYHNVILEENNRLKLLVDRVMEVSIFEKGDGRMNLTIQSAHSLINSALQGLAVIIQKKSGSLQMHLNASNDFIQIDSNHFQNIISNLVENAIKYSNLPPEISITTSNQDKEFLIQITDNGIGIDKNELSEIFTKYYRSRQSKEIKTGFGLGLYYVDKVMKAHDAQIQVKSELGRGTTFLLRFKQ
jgi:K+-sensing histidine kinase KdpD